MENIDCCCCCFCRCLYSSIELLLLLLPMIYHDLRNMIYLHACNTTICISLPFDSPYSCLFSAWMCANEPTHNIHTLSYAYVHRTAYNTHRALENEKHHAKHLLHRVLSKHTLTDIYFRFPFSIITMMTVVVCGAAVKHNNEMWKTTIELHRSQYVWACLLFSLALIVVDLVTSAFGSNTEK